MSNPRTPVYQATAAEPASDSRAPDSVRLRIAYLTTSYPKVSHTFIRREILELERRGHEVLRLAINDGQSVDPVDAVERRKTIHCLSRSTWRLLADSAIVAATRPLAALRALGGAWKLHRKSDRGLFRHLAYFIEACTFLRVLAAQRIPHVHVHFGTNAASVMWLVRKLGGPTYSFTVHGPEELDGPRTHGLGIKIAGAEFVVAITSFCKAQLCRWVDHRHWSKIHVVRCGLEVAFFETPSPIPRQCRTLLSVGRLTAQKGQLLLLEALKRVIDAGVDARLVLAGDGEMREAVEQRIRELGIEEHVHITGWISGEEVRRLLKECRAMVLPSFAEGLPIVLMEALAAQRPVISTFIAGIPELIRPGINGWLVPAGDVEELAAAMVEALEAPVDSLELMGREGRRAVEAHHRVEDSVGALVALFGEAIEKGARRA